MGRRTESLRVAVVAARFNQAVTRRLVRGAVDLLARRGVPRSDVELHWVAGSFEVPQAAERLAARARRRPGAIVALGCIVQGETDHHAHLGAAVLSQLLDVARRSGIPVGLGIVSARTAAQAYARAGGARGNRGAAAAEAALDLARTFRGIAAGKGA